jgi:hypothetical protein
LLRLYVLSHIPSSSPSQANRPTNSSQGWYTVGQLPRHTIYAPRNTPQNAKLPVLLWGNGACSADGLSAVNFLSQIASHGVLVISQGTPWGQGSTSGQQMRDALNFITSPQARNVNADFAKVDSSRILAAGFSCGGIEAYEQIWDDRVFGVGIWNSGLLNNYEPVRHRLPERRARLQLHAARRAQVEGQPQRRPRRYLW